MVTQEAFDRQNDKGTESERRVAHCLIEAGITVQWKGDRARRDLTVWTDCRCDIVEVKNEDGMAGTGNIAVETRQGVPRRRSGIMASESTVYIHTLGERAVLYRTLDMRNYIADVASQRGQPIPFHKSDNNNCGYLIGVNDLTNNDWYDYIDFTQLPHSPIWGFVMV